MPYKISGTTEEARIIIIEESGWTIESNTEESAGSYSVEDLAAGKKLIIARKSDGEAVAFGDVDSVYYTPPARGIFAGGNTSHNQIDYITINSTGNATDMGDMTTTRELPAACSNGTSNRMVVGGGYSGGYLSSMEYFNMSSFAGSSFFGSLATGGRTNMGGSDNGSNGRGFFISGSQSGGVRNYIEYITISSTGNSTDFGDVINARADHHACSNLTGNRVITIDGHVSLNYFNATSLGDASDFGDLSQARTLSCAGTSNGTNNRAVFGGGNTNGNVIDYVTITTTGNATDFGDLTINKWRCEAVSNGTNDRGVWGGADTSGGINNHVIDYVTISTTGNAMNFGSLTVGRQATAGAANA